MPLLALVSSLGGTGRTFLAANLAPWLQTLSGRPVLVASFLNSTENEAALHWGMPRPGVLDDLAEGGADPLKIFPCAEKQPVFVASLKADSAPAVLDRVSNTFGWVLVDALDLGRQGWQEWLEYCRRGLVVERGDLAGWRRAGGLVRELENRHFALASLKLAFNQACPDQPLEGFPGLSSFAIPAYPKATLRLAQGLPPCVAEPSCAFSKAMESLAKALVHLPEMPRRDRVLETPPPAASLVPLAAPQNSGILFDAGRLSLVRRTLSELLEQLDLKKISLAEMATAQFRENWKPKVEAAAQSLLARENAAWLDREERASLARELVCHVLGYGPLEGALADPEVSEIMVNHKDQVYLERRGRLSLSDIRFWDDAQLLGVIERIVAPLGRRIDESSPRVDARLPDGSRVNAIIPPLALKGPCLTIRKFPSRRLTLEDLVAGGSLSPAAAAFLQTAVKLRKNMVVSGGTGSGKTTLLNVLSSFIPEGERIVTVEDSAELKLDQAHVVSLESRPPNLEGRGAVAIRDLVSNCLRMRPDRIVVGECRGGEALDMLQAMNTGHEGSLTTVHANNPRDCLSRLETLCLMSEIELPQKVVRSQIASAVDLIVQAARLKDGSRRITSITEVLGMEGEVVTAQEIFGFKSEGFDKDGRVLGGLKPTGVVPKCFHLAREAGQEVDMTLFR